ncbi:MAG: hypothetical protein J5517_09940 [Eubacterium sp.]|nr:hypothetical protein [Eubacterium sp.]
MSQAKVDKYKEEKKNRAKIMKRNKIKKAIGIFIAALGLGAIIGIPVGKKIYSYEKEKAARNATITALDFDDWFNKKWAGSYSSLFANAQALQDMLNSSTATDADAEEEYIDDEDLDVEDIEVEGDEIDGESFEIDPEDVEFEE